MALLKKKDKGQVEIPSASQADIAFLLLIFFMVATTIDTDKGIGLILPPPGNETIEVRKENLCNIILDPHGTVMLDNKEVDVRNIKMIVENKIANNPKIIFAVKAHPRTKYDKYIAVLDQLKQAKATRISVVD